MKRINIFFHVATINHYKSIVENTLELIHKSGLYDECENIFLCIVGNEDLNISDPKIKKIHNPNIEHGEFFTLKILEDFCKENDSLVLYLHTKGVTTPGNKCIDDWRNYMLFFNVEKYKTCIDSLKENDTCGVDLVTTPTNHYSGNFWWSKSSHIKNLPKIEEINSDSFPTILTKRHNAEFWICISPGRFKNLWSSNINVYERHLHEYNRDKYDVCNSL